MPRCVSCGSEVTPPTPFCAFCGKPLDGGGAQAVAFPPTAPEDPTLEAPQPPLPPARPSSPRRSSLDSYSAGRFTPGMLIAARYRIIALLGRGGMGEVYRADDLTLGQQVALKFLPAAVTDESTLERFRNEVRIARRISHPNVCRVYDIGQAEGQRSSPRSTLTVRNLALCPLGFAPRPATRHWKWHARSARAWPRRT